MKKHIKALGVMIGAILLFKVVGIIIQLFMKDILKINLIANIQSTNFQIRHMAGIQSSLSGIAMDLIVFFILVIIFFNKGGLIERVKLNRGYKIEKLKFIVPATWGAILVGGIFSSIAIAILGTNPLTSVMFNEMFRTPFGVIQAVIIAPIVEETLLRGVVFNYLRRDYKLGTAIILQALVFGILHGNVAQGFNAFIIGIVFAVIYIYTDSLWGDITAHMLTNGTVTFITLIRLSGNTALLGIVTPIMGIIIIASLIIAIRMYRKKVSKVVWIRKEETINNGVTYSEEYLKSDENVRVPVVEFDVNEREDNSGYKELKKPSKKGIVIAIIVAIIVIIIGINIGGAGNRVKMATGLSIMAVTNKIQNGIENAKIRRETEATQKKVEEENKYNQEHNLKYTNGQVTSKSGVASNIYNDAEFVGISNEVIYKKYNNQVLENTDENQAQLIIKYYNPNNLTKQNLADFYNEVVKPSKKTYYLLDIYKPTYGFCFYVSGGFNVGDMDSSYIISLNNNMIIGNIDRNGKITATSGSTGRKIPFILKD